jgi:glutathione peroxidase
MRSIGILAAAFASLLMATANAAEPRSAHAFTFTSIDGGPLPLRQFAGQAVLVVNTASLCGFTYQYDGLQALWESYRGRGLIVLGVPSNDFGGQEPGSATEIKEFCEVNFDLDFPLTEKQTVRGEGAHPFFQHVTKVLGDAVAPRWNFHKYLIAPNGRLTGAWPTRVEPDAPELLGAIEAVLPD